MDPTAAEEETILVADDEPAVRQLICSILESHGYRVLQAENGREGLAVAAAHEGPIHLLISDVLMPELDGPGLAIQLQAVRPEVRVILISGHTTRLMALDYGWPLLQKPFLPNALIKTIHHVMSKPQTPPKRR